MPRPLAAGMEIFKVLFLYSQEIFARYCTHITSLEATSGEAYDGHHCCSFVDQDLAQDLPVNTYTADRGYDDGNNHYHLKDHDLNSAICLKSIRTKKKDANYEVWLDLIQTSAYQEGRKERHKVERKFGEAKKGH